MPAHGSNPHHTAQTALQPVPLLLRAHCRAIPAKHSPAFLVAGSHSPVSRSQRPCVGFAGQRIRGGLIRAASDVEAYTVLPRGVKAHFHGHRSNGAYIAKVHSQQTCRGFGKWVPER